MAFASRCEDINTSVRRREATDKTRTDLQHLKAYQLQRIIHGLYAFLHIETDQVCVSNLKHLDESTETTFDHTLERVIDDIVHYLSKIIVVLQSELHHKEDPIVSKQVIETIEALRSLTHLTIDNPSPSNHAMVTGRLVSTFLD